MNHEIHRAPIGFTQRHPSDGDPGADAFQLAAEWLDERLAQGWEPLGLVVRGTTGHVNLSGPGKANLVFRRVQKARK